MGSNISLSGMFSSVSSSLSSSCSSSSSSYSLKSGCPYSRQHSVPHSSFRVDQSLFLDNHWDGKENAVRVDVTNADSGKTSECAVDSVLTQDITHDGIVSLVRRIHEPCTLDRYISHHILLIS